MAKIAKSENRNISDLVREIVRRCLEEHDREARLDRELAVLEALTLLGLKIEEQHGIYKGDLFEEACAERDEDVDQVWRGEA